MFNVKKLQLIQSWIFVTRFYYITFPYYYSVFLWFVFPSLLAKSSTYLCLFTVIAWLTLENKTPWQPIFVLNFLKVNQLQQRKHLSVNICVALTEKEILWGAFVGFNKYKTLRIFDVSFTQGCVITVSSCIIYSELSLIHLWKLPVIFLHSSFMSITRLPFDKLKWETKLIGELKVKSGK